MSSEVICKSGRCFATFVLLALCWEATTNVRGDERVQDANRMKTIFESGG